MADAIERLSESILDVRWQDVRDGVAALSRAPWLRDQDADQVDAWLAERPDVQRRARMIAAGEISAGVSYLGEMYQRDHWSPPARSLGDEIHQARRDYFEQGTQEAATRYARLRIRAVVDPSHYQVNTFPAKRGR